jgi:thiamine biosynthesis lipoprotein
VKCPLFWCAFSLVPVLVPVAVPQAQEQPARERHVSEFRGLTMGGTFSVKIVTPKDELETPGLQNVDRVLRSSLDRIEGLMSTWDPDSELSRFNRSTSLEPFTVAPETFAVFKWSLEVGSVTGGALDVTVAPLVDAWGFGPSGPRKTLPTNDEIERLRQAVGPGLVELNPTAVTVRKTRPDVQCDLSSVVPGYAADRIGGELRDRGFTSAAKCWLAAATRPARPGRSLSSVRSCTAIRSSASWRSQIWRSPPQETTGSIAKSMVSESHTSWIREPAVR